MRDLVPVPAFTAQFAFSPQPVFGIVAVKPPGLQPDKLSTSGNFVVRDVDCDDKSMEGTVTEGENSLSG
jgi:hypothetical protein